MSIYINPVLDNSPDDPRLDDDAVIVTLDEYEDMKTEAIEEKWREEKTNGNINNQANATTVAACISNNKK